jgi:ADP-heptose:LPS heptosyltransferase
LVFLKTTSIINQINKKNYDALVDLNSGEERLISLICLKLIVPIKIGFQSSLADNLYTLIVQATENSFLEKHYKMIENLLSLNQE